MNFSRNNIEEKIKHLFFSLGESDVSPSAYDTAWIARISNSQKKEKPAFENSLNWLIKNQHQDGSWGNINNNNYHDKIISTLNAIITLQKWNISNDLVEKGINYFNENISNLKNDHHETLGFELIFTSLLSKAQKMGIPFNYKAPIIDKYKMMRENKLRKIPLNIIFEVKTSISYSLEFLEDNDDITVEQLKFHKEKNGSIGCSPAATAFYLERNNDKDSYDYIEKLTKINNGAAPNVHSIDIFEKAWSVDLLFDLGLEKSFENEIKKQTSSLNEIWNDEGLSFSSHFNIPELDSTAVVYRILNLSGYNKNPEIFENFLEENKFFCYKGQKEANPSYLANLIKALKVIDDCYLKKTSFIEIARKQLKEYAKTHFTDKWHLSPYYTFSRMIGNYDHISSNKLISEIIAKQNSDGSWGYFDGTMEETALVLSAIFSSSKNLKDFHKEILKAVEYLKDNLEKLDDYNLDRLWIGKSMYAPYNVVKMYIYTVLFYFMKEFEIRVI